MDLYVATQWLHSDLRQIAPVLGLPPEKVRMTLSGVGGAFGGREDLSMQIQPVCSHCAPVSRSRSSTTGSSRSSAMSTAIPRSCTTSTGPPVRGS